MNHAFLSLEQEFTLRTLSIQVQQNTDVAKLQDELIKLWEKILIKHQNLKNVYYFSRGEVEELALYLRASETFVSEVEELALYLRASGTFTLEVEAIMNGSCLDLIRENFAVEELQVLLIEANEIFMIQRNYTDFISQYMLDHQSMI